jgi:tetratricopeptide (TPR) repeat protein
MMRWLGQLVALPLKVLLILVSIVPVFDRLGLYRAIWALTRDPYYGRNLILLLAQRRGMDAARSLAEEAFATCPDGSIAAMIGQLELNLAFDLERGAGWLGRAKEHPDLRNPAGLLLLELSLCHHIPELDSDRVIESILSRNDLSMDLTQLAMLAKAQLDLRAGRWDDALQITEKLLAINEIPLAHWILWVAYSALQERELAEQEFRRLSAKTLGPLYEAVIASGYHYLGDVNRCRDHLLECRKAGIPDRYILLNEPDMAGPLSELPPQTEPTGAAS